MQGPNFKGIQTFLNHLALSGVTSVRSNTQDVDYVFIFLCFMIFMYDNKTLCFHADVVYACPEGKSPMDRRAGARFVHIGDDEITKLEENLGHLTLDIPNVVIDDLPRRFQRHTAGVSG